MRKVGDRERERERSSLVSSDTCCDQGFMGPARRGGISALQNASMGMVASHAINTAPQRCGDLPNQFHPGTESPLTQLNPSAHPRHSGGD